MHRSKVAAPLENAKRRAEKLGIECLITYEDVHIPEFCPALGIPLRLHAENGRVADNSPTLDRINSHLGYTPGNVAVISHRANSIKRSASIDELEQVIAYMKSHGSERPTSAMGT